MHDAQTEQVLRGHVGVVAVVFGTFLLAALLWAGYRLFRRWQMRARGERLLSIKAGTVPAPTRCGAPPLSTKPRSSPSDAGIELRGGMETEGGNPHQHEGNDPEAEAAAAAAAAARRASIRAETKPKPRKLKEEKGPLSVGQVVYYNHHHSGWILAKVTSVDMEGAQDGGVTYVIEAPQITGVLETTRKKLFIKMPAA